jgi:MraZ protein
LFRGNYIYNLDAKGRLSIPAKLRKQISPEANDTFIITKGTGQCIDLYPLDEWQHLEKKLLELNVFIPEDAKFVRMILQDASEDTMDNQSRITIPQQLKNHAGITKEVLLLGVLKKIELWNPENYNNYINQTEETYEQIAAKVMAK